MISGVINSISLIRCLISVLSPLRQSNSRFLVAVPMSIDNHASSSSLPQRPPGLPLTPGSPRTLYWQNRRGVWWWIWWRACGGVQRRAGFLALSLWQWGLLIPCRRGYRWCVFCVCSSVVMDYHVFIPIPIFLPLHLLLLPRHLLKHRYCISL